MSESEYLTFTGVVIKNLHTDRILASLRGWDGIVDVMDQATEIDQDGNRAIVDIMDHVICADDVACGKPEPDLHRWQGIEAVNVLVSLVFAPRNRGREPRGDAGCVCAEPISGRSSVAEGVRRNGRLDDCVARDR
jgi:hypothetical protein